MSAQLSDDGRRVVVDLAGFGLVEAAAIWLRDACHCAACRRGTTNERRVVTTTIDPAIEITSLAVAGDRIDLTTTDGHHSVVPLARLELIARAAPAAAVAERHASEGSPVAATELVRFSSSELSTRLREILDRLAADGALVVEGVEPNESALRAAAETIAPVQPTNYPSVWSIEAVIDPVSEVESSRGLLVHTDLPYRRDPPGVQLLLACQTDVAGGASTLVDGVAAAERLRAADPDAFRLLARVPVEHPYARDTVEIRGRSPLIELDDRDEVRVVRRAPDLMGSPAVVADDAVAFHRALTTWWSMLDDPAVTLTLPLEPGELLMFDNHRMLHGRTAFDLGASGRRVLRGCYLHRDDVASRRAVLSRI